jgi:hypothetical protein
MKDKIIHNIPDMRKRFMGPLKKNINAVERLMSNKKWSEIDYLKVPAKALKNYIKAYQHHDNQRFTDYIMENKLGTKNVSTRQLLPYEIVNAAWICSDDETASFLNLQWKNYIESISEDTKSRLKTDIAVCDVSGSMGWGGNPLYIDVAISLSLLIADVSKQPLISFSQTPSVISFSIKDIAEKNKCSPLQAENIVQKVRYLRSFDDMGTTNLELTFILLARYILSGILKNIERLWIFTDGQFDSMCTVGDDSKKNRNLIAVEKIKEIFAKYKLIPPKIMFWNIGGMTTDYIVNNDDSNISLLSGFSQTLMKSALNNTSTTPYELMKDLLEDTKYAALDALF